MKKNPNLKPALAPDLLSATLADITDPKLMRECLLLLFNEKELLNLIKRLEILHQLKLGHSYTDIQKELAVSSATVSRIASLSEGKVALKVYKYFLANKWMQEKAFKVKNWLPSLFSKKDSSNE